MARESRIFARKEFSAENIAVLEAFEKAKSKGLLPIVSQNVSWLPFWKSAMFILYPPPVFFGSSDIWSDYEFYEGFVFQWFPVIPISWGYHKVQQLTPLVT